jgi:hypothetical protein
MRFNGPALLIVIVTFFLPTELLLADEPPIAVTVDSLNAKIEAIRATTELEEKTRARLEELYKKTISYLEAARSNKETAAAFGRARDTASPEAAVIRKQLEQLEGSVPDVVAGVSAEMPFS